LALSIGSGLAEELAGKYAVRRAASRAVNGANLRLCAFLETLQCIKPEIGARQEEQHMTPTPNPIPEAPARLPSPELAAILGRNAKPIEDPAPPDAEEEEFAQLWADDRGNQGA
jgi:hypothetical protein